jgi:hypothetical protein
VRVDATEGGRAFLADWGARLDTHCLWDPGRGMHWDQRWLDLAAARHPAVAVLRDPGINVGYWALPERDGAHLRLFHFSGYQPSRPNRATKYSPRVGADELAPLPEYARLLREAGVDHTLGLPYSWDRFDNGVPVPAIARTLVGDRSGDPFATGPGSFFDWLCSRVDRGAPVVTQLWQAVWASRPDLQAGFPDHLGADREGFVEWTRRTETDHDVDPAFVI